VTHPDDNTLALLVDGALADDARVEVETHLDTCEACSDLVSELAWVVGNDRQEPPAGYRFVRKLPGNAWDAVASAGAAGARSTPGWSAESIELGPAMATPHSAVHVELGFGGPWPATLAAVRDRHLATVYAIGREGGQGFVVYEPCGRTFREWCKEVPRSPDALLTAWRDAMRGLAALHRAGFVHGRVSPDHIYIADDGRVFVGGYARELGKTSGYIAPDVIAGQPPTAAADQFGACAVLWEALADKKPFSGATAGALAIVMTSPPARPPRAHRAFAALERGLAAEPDRRWPSIDALVTELERRPRPLLWLALALLVIGVVVAALR
jgi:hypothetical protein